MVASKFKATNCQLPHFANEFFGSIVCCKVNHCGPSYEESSYMWSTIGDVVVEWIRMIIGLHANP